VNTVPVVVCSSNCVEPWLGGSSPSKSPSSERLASTTFWPSPELSTKKPREPLSKPRLLRLSEVSITVLLVATRTVKSPSLVLKL